MAGFFKEEHPHWDDMPEFEQEKQESYAKIILRVESKEHLEELEKLLQQKLTTATKSIWYPKLERGKTAHLRYVNDES